MCIGRACRDVDCASGRHPARRPGSRRCGSGLSGGAGQVQPGLPFSTADDFVGANRACRAGTCGAICASAPLLPSHRRPSCRRLPPVARHEMPSPMSDAPLREWQCRHAESMKILEKVTPELRDPVHAVSRARVGLGREAQPMRVFRTAHSRQMAGVAEAWAGCARSLVHAVYSAARTAVTSRSAWSPPGRRRLCGFRSAARACVR